MERSDTLTLGTLAHFRHFRHFQLLNLIWDFITTSYRQQEFQLEFLLSADRLRHIV